MSLHISQTPRSSQTLPSHFAEVSPGTFGLISLIFFVLILGLAISPRFAGINWGSPAHRLDNEEELLYLQKTISPPHSIGNYLDFKTSPLNPYLADYSYETPIYGSFPSVLSRIFLGANTETQNSTELYRVKARKLSAIADILVIVLLGFIGVRAFGPAVGLLAVLFYSFSPVNITASHIYSSEWAALLPHTLILFLVLPAANSEKLEISSAKFAYFGVLFGLAIALDPRNLILATLLPFLSLIAGVNADRGAAEGRRSDAHPVSSLMLYSVLALLGTWVVFRLSQPYAFEAGSLLELNRVFSKSISQILFGEPATIPSLATLPASPTFRLFKLYQFGTWGFGPIQFFFLLILLFLGTLPRVLFRGKIFLLPLYALTASGLLLVLFQNHPDPFTLRFAAPSASLLFAEGICALFFPHPSSSRSLGALLLSAMLLLVGGTFSYVNSSLFQVKDQPLDVASSWIESNLPKGKMLLVEHGAVRLPGTVDGRTPGPYRFSEFSPFAEDTEETANLLRTQLKKADALIFSSSASEEISTVERTRGLAFFEELQGESSNFRIVEKFHCSPKLLDWQKFAQWVPLEIRELFCPEVSIYLPKR